MSSTLDLSSAISDFHKARSQAELKLILSRLTGESTQLLSYDEVIKKLKLQGSSDRGLHDIPLPAIVGSVGRYTDFTRGFLPRTEVNQSRWARIKMAATDLAGLPPIEVYKIGDAYFVKDGNHRVSVARDLGATHIQAYVTEIRTRVPLTVDATPDDLILKAEYADFLERTQLDEIRPQADLTVTVPGKYQNLLEHIDVHRYFMGIEQQRDISYQEAVAHWYDTVYLPVVQIIRERGILQSFPNRTETDLYLWLAEHRAVLERELGWEMGTDTVAADLLSQQSVKRGNLILRLGGRILDAITQNVLEEGPPPGQWRKQVLDVRRDDRLFTEILVPLSGGSEGWIALDQALVVAQRENARLHGLHVVSTPEELDRETARSVQEEFNRRCNEAGVQGSLVLAAGEIAEEICRRSRVTDLIVPRLAYPPPSQVLARVSYGFRDLIQRCPRPILATPQETSPLRQPLLAYDGSPKAREALFVATYLAGQWGLQLRVVSVEDGGRKMSPILEQARDYLESHGITAQYHLESGPFPSTIIQAANEYQSDLLIMGGYGYTPLLEMVLGGGVDQVLRESHKPILICR